MVLDELTDRSVNSLLMRTRDQLVTAAGDLFYSRGIHASGIDAVVERSGFSKPTLYKHFRSKHELVTAVVEMRATNRRAALEEMVAKTANDPRRALEAVLDYFVAWYSEDDYRGCALVNGAIEIPDPDNPGRHVIREHKLWMTGFLEDLVGSGGFVRPRQLAESLVLLEEGATVMAYVTEGREIGGQLRRAFRALLDAHESTPPG